MLFSIDTYVQSLFIQWDIFSTVGSVKVFVTLRSNSEKVGNLNNRLLSLFFYFLLSFPDLSFSLSSLNQTLDPYSLSQSSLSSSHQIELALKVKSLKLGSLKSFAKISQSSLFSSHQGHHHKTHHRISGLPQPTGKTFLSLLPAIFA